MKDCFYCYYYFSYFLSSFLRWNPFDSDVRRITTISVYLERVRVPWRWIRLFFLYGRTLKSVTNPSSGQKSRLFDTGDTMAYGIATDIAGNKFGCPIVCWTSDQFVGGKINDRKGYTQHVAIHFFFSWTMMACSTNSDSRRVISFLLLLHLCLFHHLG